MKIHVLEEARHITYAREELVRQIAERGPVSNAFHRGVFALAVIGIYPVLFNPKAYRSVGIHPLRGLYAFLTSPNYRENATWVSEPLMRFRATVADVAGDARRHPGRDQVAISARAELARCRWQ
ncbi:P-aminobenzoate N-oxygenase AurF [Mycobacteroides abscessus subsp. massiliense]|nr:P-aminobenzoate N-oxygenase AurF [Mycobacteroides abscessus subsp. massiliense]